MNSVPWAYVTLDGQRQWLQRLQQSDRDQVWIIELLDGARPANAFDPGTFWSGDDLDLLGGARLGEEIAVRVPRG